MAKLVKIKKQSTPESICCSLLMAKSEQEVIDILKVNDLWDIENWKDFGQKENNYSIIGAQQADPVAALVEKLVNSVDAVLMRECLLRSIGPETKHAPNSVAAALEMFFSIKNGNLANISAEERTKLAENIGLIATGERSKPNYIVFDKGEGQSPDSMSSTFLSLSESNKLRIPFVQGKFNMGGTGVFRFCGTRSFQLIISKRHPKFGDASNNWGFTIVRRDDPYGGLRNSVYKYLAPAGKILRFPQSDFAFPGYKNGTQDLPTLQWGTIIKLYAYEMTGFRTNILFDLYNQISLILPKAGLPVRFYERRNYEGHSLESTMAGLHVRLEDDKRENLESGFPTYAEFNALNQKFKASIYVFKPQSNTKYKKNEGILFTYNGQTHGSLPKSFFTRKNVGMSYLADSILVIIECDQIDQRTFEILFMNSRDRLSGGDLRTEIEKKVEEVLGSHQGLRELREKRKREAAEAMLADMKPLKEALEDILKKSPSLQALFFKGSDFGNPFKSKTAGVAADFIGKVHPTYFRLMKGHEKKQCHINLRFRVQFETDAQNDYFLRDRYPGKLIFQLNGRDVTDSVFNLWNGIATLTVRLPDGTKEGDKLNGEVSVEDETLIAPFKLAFVREVIGVVVPSGGNGKRPPPSGNEGGDREILQALSLPNVYRVKQEEWDKPHLNFDKFSALKIINDGEGQNQFYVNIDNWFLKNEIKSLARNSDPRLLEARYEYSMVLIGIALIRDKDKFAKIESGETTDIYEQIMLVTSAVSAVALPMIEVLGSLEPEDIGKSVTNEFED
jgi:hypothetical protein